MTTKPLPFPYTAEQWGRLFEAAGHPEPTPLRCALHDRPRIVLTRDGFGVCFQCAAEAAKARGKR